MKKRPVLLLELMISFVLFGILMTFLISSYRELVLAKALLRKDKERILNQQRLQLRLAQVFSKLEQINPKDKAFFLTFDNGLDANPAFRGVIEGALYIDKQNQLVLVTYSSQDPSKAWHRLEVLWENLDEFEISFLDTGLAGFNKTYPKEKPTLMKIFLTTDKKTLTLPLIL